MRPLRICVIASSRFPIAEPYAGGLEAHTAALVVELRRRGHEVDLFAAPGSSPSLDVRTLPVAPFESSPAARADLAAPPETWMREHHAYLDLMLELHRGTGDGRPYDVVHNNSLHHLPVAMAATVAAPVVTTLHTPPIPWLESAIGLSHATNTHFIAVSHATRGQWAPVVDAEVVHNGIDTDAWTPGPGGDRAIWFGRLVPEKAPHAAVLAARAAGVALDLVGPVGDPAYVAEKVRPLLDDPAGPHAGYRHLGHLARADLARAVGSASVAVLTPAWEEPFGLVAAEAMSCGTPVAAYARGALPEIVDAETGRLADPDDVDGLAVAIREAAGLDRDVVRTSAVKRFGLTAMVDAYEDLYRRAVLDLGRAA
ncbi:glycosyltransferase [Nocardioides sp. CFH 31398]|uniref:glycosyltransferase n=1 Tax=Nocardioides sp. CFH 31398 TaxID=2919579 RepID=UPI001F066A0E|nr:glycosyltransferase [Nocardioides sp. CFH 31398]MCH1868716.1 glycosyltransferase [Nocardioides sp. CFH 31398]